MGLGGLGHMALTLAHAMGAEVTLFTTSPDKEDARRLGADHVVLSRDVDQMAAVANQSDFILVTVAVSIDLAPSVQALKRDGTLVMVGAPSEPHKGPPST